MDQREELALLIDPDAGWSRLAHNVLGFQQRAQTAALQSADRAIAAGWEKRSPAGEADKTLAEALARLKLNLDRYNRKETSSLFISRDDARTILRSSHPPAERDEADKTRALAEALEPLALLAADPERDVQGVRMNDPLSVWFTVGQLHRAKDALRNYYAFAAAQPVNEVEE